MIKTLCYLHENMYFYQIKQTDTMGYAEIAQLEIMNAAANVASQEDLDDLRMTLSKFFAERAQRAIDKLWDEGKLNQDKLDELRGKHLRTPYN